MTTLITGATGFIGSSLAHQLLAEGHTVRALTRNPAGLEKVGLAGKVEVAEGDITDAEAVGQAVAGCGLVYAIAGTFREPNLSDARYHEVNVGAVEIMVRAAAEHGVRRVVHCSTCGIHGNVPLGQSVAEDSPFNGVGIYEETKAAGDQRARDLGAELGVEVVVIRPTQVYGPGDTRLLKLFKMADKDRPLIIGSGKCGYHLVYIDDLVDAFVLAGTSEQAPGEAFLVGGGEVPSLNELFAELGRVFGRENPKPRRPPALPFMVAGVVCETICRPLGISPPIYRRRVEFFTNNRSFDISKARERLGYAPKVTMADGLRRTAQWYRDEGMIA
ncbi:MAG: NAD-dependent epimerase/dehydratase family protein [Phycisphaerales bacterium JB063]